VMGALANLRIRSMCDRSVKEIAVHGCASCF
jgi:hypothetical protein